MIPLYDKIAEMASGKLFFFRYFICRYFVNSTNIFPYFSPTASHILLRTRIEIVSNARDDFSSPAPSRAFKPSVSAIRPDAPPLQYRPNHIYIKYHVLNFFFYCIEITHFFSYLIDYDSIICQIARNDRKMRCC